MGSIKTAWRVLETDRQTLHLILIVVGGYVLVQIAIALVGGILQIIPLLGIVIYLPYSIAAHIFGIYLYMAVLAAVISHYADSVSIRPNGASGSTAEEDTSPSRASWQVPPPFYPYGRK